MPNASLRAEDELAIRALVARYHDAVSTFDVDAWAATWAVDATWKVGQRTLAGRDAIVEFWSGTIMPRYRSRIFQVLGQGRVWVDGDGAAGRWTFLDVGHKSDADRAHLEMCCYRDRYVVEAGRWVFSERRFSLGYRRWTQPGEFFGLPPIE